MNDKITPKPEPEVALAIEFPDPRIRKLAEISRDSERAVANMDAIMAEKRAKEGGA